MGSIRVIGLGGLPQHHNWRTLLQGRAIVARSTSIQHGMLPGHIIPDITFDELFDTDDVLNAAETIAGEIRDLGEHSDVAYLVPGSATVGDTSVEALATGCEIEIVPGSLPLSLMGKPVVAVDALSLAVAEALAPFDPGLIPIDPLMTTLITNWYGTRVTELAAAQLGSRYGVDQLPEPDEDGNLILPAQPATAAPPSVAALQHIYARLRRPDGCPWDREQTATSLIPALREEVEEFAEALMSGNERDAAEELGDVIGNTIMIAQIEAERGAFRFEDAVEAIAAKLVRRHPHVFGDVRASSAVDVLAIWNQVKQQEKHQRNGEGRETG